MECYDGFPGSGGSGDTGRTGVFPFHQLPLFGVEEDRPFFPGEVEGLLQLFDVRHHPEASPGVGMGERVGGDEGDRHTGLAACGEFQQGFGRLGGKVLDERQEGVGIGSVDDISLSYQEHAPGVEARATRDGNNYTVTGTAIGYDKDNPDKQITKPFEVSVTCP